MVAEAAEPVEWTKPDELAFNDVPAGPAGGQTFPVPKLGGLFDGGFHGLMCDGAVRFYSATLSEKKLRALITVNGGEVIAFEPSEYQDPPRDNGKASAHIDEPSATKPPPAVKGPTKMLQKEPSKP